MVSLIKDWQALFQDCANSYPQTIFLPTIAIANPPYCTINTASDQSLTRFKMSYKWQTQESGNCIITSKLKKQVEQEWLFIEQCLNQVKPGEIVCLLVSNSILSESKSLHFRRWLLEEMVWLIAVIQLPTENFQVECDLAIITSIVILKRKCNNLPVPDDYSIFMAIVEKIGFDSRGRRLFRSITHEQIQQKIDSDLPIIVDKFNQFIQEVWDSNCDQ